MKQYLVYLFLGFFIVACSKKKSVEVFDDSPDMLENDSLLEDSIIESSQDNVISASKKPFYPMDETIEDIQDEISDLKTRVIEYESRINNMSLDPSLMRMIKLPVINHEIELINGTIVQGSILQEDIDRIILKTQIGQIRIEKSDIITIKEIAPNSPILSFNSEPEQKIYDDKRVFSGDIINEGVRRADFARVVFYLWDENTNLISSDSSFINGSTIQYSSGIVTDCSIEPSESANYNVSVSIPDTANVRYITKEIHFNIYE